MAPWLGQFDVPGFTSLLELYPECIKPFIVPIGGFLMGTVSVAVAFYAQAATGKARIVTVFTRTLRCMIVALVATIALYFSAVDRVDTPNDGSFAFVTGFSERHAECPCKQGMTAVQCIADEVGISRVETCWPEKSIKLSRALLSVSYLVLIGCFGALVGCLVSYENRGTLAATGAS
jgi:hypothetical protein